MELTSPHLMFPDSDIEKRQLLWRAIEERQAYIHQLLEHASDLENQARFIYIHINLDWAEREIRADLQRVNDLMAKAKSLRERAATLTPTYFC